jgi:4-oxalocrotonate tautomerase
MPSIQVKLIENVFTPEQKSQIASKLTDDRASIEGADVGTVAWVDIEEVLTDEWEIGGLAMTTDAIRALVAGE